MDRSESVTKLITALSKAQGEFSAVSKTGRNPHLKNTYATLDNIISAIRGPLSKNGIVFTQPLSGDGEGFALETVLMHESGEWLSCSAPIPHLAENRGVNELQAFGGALTYMRRYMLSALLGINTEEDTDGNGGKPKAKRKAPAPKAKRKPPAPKPKKPEPAEDTKSNGEHWIDKVDENGKGIRARFWTWCGAKTLTNDQVYGALEVTSIHDYTGSMADAKTQIIAWIAAEQAAEVAGAQ